MIKKGILILSIVIISLGLLISCRKEENPIQDENTVDLYFLSSNEDILISHSYQLKSTGLEKQIEEILLQLIKGTKRVGEIGLLPHDLVINNISLGSEIVKIDFSKAYYANVQNEFLARLSIVQSIGQLDNVTNVELTIEGQPIKDSNDKIIASMNVSNYIVSMGSPDELKRKSNIKLFFANAAGDKLVQETISADIPFNLPMEYTVVELLLDGPISEGQQTTINPKTKINSIKIKNGICYIDLSREFLESTLDINEDVIVYSLVNTLVELSNFNKVKIYINGKAQDVYRDKVKMSGFLERNLDIIGEIVN